MVAFVPHGDLVVRSAGYVFWLLFNAAVVLAAVQLFRTAPQLESVLRAYLYSFLFVALFGVVQFVMPILGLGAPLVRQWWFPGVIARVNGFSYEPSYFATYLLLGWTLAVVLLERRSSLMPRRRLLGILVAITLAMLLSSSRMGWLLMLLWCARYPALFAARMLRGRVNLRHARRGAALGVAAAALSAAIVTTVGIESLRFLGEGVGVAGTSSNSVSQRSSEMADVLRVFGRSPIIGYSLGGVAPAIARLRGGSAETLAAAKESEGMNIFAEVLAASGIVGVIPFALYVALLIVAPTRRARRVRDPELRTLLVGMTAALAMELLILQFNQNILRLYLWLHISLLCALYAAARSAIADTRSAPAAT
jgi:O-antigen ligase